MRARILTALVAGALALPVASASADVHLTIVDGYVTLDAKDATVRQILAEWSRVGQTRVVNAERITGGPMTLQLTHVPEAVALDILLRSVSGYMAAPRPSALPNASRFDRILVMPTSTPPQVSTPPQSSPQQFQPQMPTDDLDVDEPAFQPQPVAVPGQRGPIFPQFPNGGGQGPSGGFPQRGPAFQQQGLPVQPQMPFPQGEQAIPPPPTAPGTMPIGVSTPGMIVQPPTQPGQPGAPPEPQG